MRLGLPFFLHCLHSRVRVSHRTGEGSLPVLVACTRRGTLSKSVMCSARVPEEPGAVRAAECRPAKGLSQSSSEGAGEAPAAGRCGPADP